MIDSHLNSKYNSAESALCAGAKLKVEVRKQPQKKLSYQ